jgi:hypothetical protein
VDVHPPFVADPQPSVLVQPADRSLDDPAGGPQTAAMYSPAMGEHGLDVPLSQLGLVRLRVVRAVALDARRTEARAPAFALERRDGVDQREELGDVVSIRTSERDHQRDALRFGEDMVLAARAGAIRGIGPRLEPPFTARMLELSTTARDQSISPAWWNSSSRTWWSCFHTPAACQSRSRRQQVIPEPQPISLGRYSHGQPLISTKMIPVRVARSATRGRPVFWGERRGRRGSINSHSASSTKGFAIVGPPCPTAEATLRAGACHVFC